MGQKKSKTFYITNLYVCRLAVTNTHQLPLAVVLCGTSQPGTLGLAAARQLASHGVRTQVDRYRTPTHLRLAYLRK